MSDAKLLTVEEAAGELQISPASMYRHITGGAVRTVNVGSDLRPRLRISRGDLDLFIAQRTSASPTDHCGAAS